jgi:hypothetical protein
MSDILLLSSVGVMTIPIMYSFMWLVVFGGAGLQMEREAARNGVYCSYSADIPLDAPIGFVCLDSDRVADEAARTADSCLPGFSKISRLSCFSAERQYFLLWEQFAAYRYPPRTQTNTAHTHTHTHTHTRKLLQTGEREWER